MATPREILSYKRAEEILKDQGFTLVISSGYYGNTEVFSVYRLEGNEDTWIDFLDKISPLRYFTTSEELYAFAIGIQVGVGSNIVG